MLRVALRVWKAALHLFGADPHRCFGFPHQINGFGEKRELVFGPGQVARLQSI
jgi:hypothetical protein